MQPLRMIAGVLLLASAPHTAAAASPADLYLDATFWQHMDWQQAPRSTLWQLEGWADFSGEQAEGFMLTKERSLSILGREFSARLGYDRKAMSHQFVSFLHASVPKAQCEPLRQALTATFGEPITHDGTIALPIAETTLMRIIGLSYQWDLGNTRITATCFGFVTQRGEVETEDGKFTWSVKYGHQSVSEKLVPKFGLSCSRTLRYAVSGDSREINDLVLWVDLYRSRVLGIDLVVLSDEDSFRASAGDIQFAMTRNGFLTDYVINRVTGALTGTISEEGQRVATLTGRCEKSQSVTRKF